ncbi:MAG: cell envelope integrity protein CreD [Bacteroidetes bacterium]|nr:cell envelope integrity protein CreD [Bacteroidota bacterium]
MNKLNQIKNNFSQSISVKIVVVTILVLLLLIPIGMIKSLITERQVYREEALQDIQEKWGKSQKVAGPILTIPVQQIKLIDEKERIYNYLLHILPDDLNYEVKITPEIRYRGMYKVVVYEANMDISGNFPNMNELAENYSNYTFKWNEAYMTIGVPDMKGIQNQLEIDLNGKKYGVTPGVKNKDIISTGVAFNTPINTEKFKKKINFKTNLILKGSKDLQFYPIGKNTYINMESPWENPSFKGNFLPEDRNNSENGFNAYWKVLNLNRNYPQNWIGDTYTIENSTFGVELLLPIDHYQKSMRSAKYALMFIFLTFICFLFFEILNNKIIHPIQYLLVSAGLVIFYILLLSLSEQIGFNKAYLLASAGIISLITIYTSSVFRSFKVNAFFAAILSTLYIYLFVILQMQDYALLMGSIGLFIILALMMYFSRRVNWYKSIDEKSSTEVQTN